MRKSLAMAIYADSIGAKRSAGQFRAAAMLFGRLDRLHRTILREGYLVKAKRRR
ncbi:hypothetical protein AB1P65_13420 [Roseibium alexandrii]